MSSREEKVEALKRAIQEWSHKPSEALVDRDREKALSPIVSRAVGLINHRPRSVEELRQRLVELEYEATDIDEVIDRCLRNGMLDDAEFARLWVDQRSRNQKKSVAVLRQELQRKGVDALHIEAALERVDAFQQEEVMRALIDKKASSIRAVPEGRAEYNKFLNRVVGVAARRGFPQSSSLRYARQALDQRISELKA